MLTLMLAHLLNTCIRVCGSLINPMAIFSTYNLDTTGCEDNISKDGRATKTIDSSGYFDGNAFIVRRQHENGLTRLN